jgi:urease accessory protein
MLGAAAGGAGFTLALPAVAYAHTGLGDAAGFVHGVLHPWMGLDHLCAMIAVGLWAAQRGRKAVWLMPLTFLAVMAFGGILGFAGAPLPAIEPGIAVSVLVLGVMVAAAVRLPLAATALLVGLFALLHGHSHGAEMPASATGLAYAMGFLAATASLHALGIALAIVCQRRDWAAAVRVAGGMIAACGAGFCLLLV